MARQKIFLIFLKKSVDVFVSMDILIIPQATELAGN